ncbi:3-phosphoshikimate 1-carboxyvinyltransferase [uncultured Muriicola sp.]|uniref:3-phosphoshikimate 1-carboxyvinyltransferase n=1 Tax=uncultured Muriicola sp. TaxID=1583102 RepID=UPI002618D0E6|nr:3-phosphoshikimate 1-carboxyvinyltransferase [uncultured Muriicola sp.]
MTLHLSGPPNSVFRSTIKITGSKSESNRLLILQALYPNLTIDNLSNADDVEVMQQGLTVTKGEVDIHHAGTAMRFLTAYFASKDGADVLLTGSSRMQERPIKVLVEALRNLGADIQYQKNEGYPPLKIKGRKLTAQKVSLPANISSQYISALLLIAASLPNGLEIELLGEITSVPYIKMTLSLLEALEIKTTFKANTIKVYPFKTAEPKNVVVESDWSSVSYYYSIVALSEIGTELEISSFTPNSLQGDRILAEVYTHFGVETIFKGQALQLIKRSKAIKNIDENGHDIPLSLHLADAPDIAQTIVVTCFGLEIGCHLTGLHTLKIKETDRLEALKNELTKLGAKVKVSDKDLELEAGGKAKKDVTIETYNDHRMAMAFAPLAMKTTLFINDAGVVSKSYPDFWKDLRELKFKVTS